MINIQKLNKISPVINEVLGTNYNCCDEIDNPDGILLRSYNMADYEVGTNLVAIGRAGAGVNNIPIARMAEHGVVVFNTPGANANAVKELVICGMLLASRDIIGGNAWVNTLTTDVAKSAEKGKGNFAGTEIDKKTLGVVGLGAIGVMVANACVSLGLKVIGYDPYLSENNKAMLDSSIEVVDLETIYAQSNIITAHVPLLDSTREMFNKDTFAKMKDNVIIINCSRGELVNVSDIKEAIASNKVAKYVVDFPSIDVLNEKNIIVFPHLGASTEEAEENCAYMASKQVAEYIEEGNIVNSVNYPNVKKERTNTIRTCILFKSAVKDTISALAEDMVIATRGDFGYAIIDSENQLPMPRIGGILKVRVI